MRNDIKVTRKLEFGGHFIRESWFSTIGLSVIIFAHIAHRLYQLSLVRTWHGAEHKVIGVYEKTGKYNIETAKQFSPIHKCCGTKFWGATVALLLVLLLVILFGFYWLWLGVLIFTMMPDCLGLKRCRNSLIDLIGKYTQRIFTVSEPSLKELLIGHCALLGLLKAQDQDINMPLGVKLIVEK